MFVDRLGRRTLFVSGEINDPYGSSNQRLLSRLFQTQACYVVRNLSG